MNSFKHFSLGETCPPSPHAVISSLPTMADVRGYEEKDPCVLSALKSGYPRFVVHAYVRQLIDFYLDREGLSGECAMLIPGRRAADDLLAWMGSGVRKVEVESSVYLLVSGSADASGWRKLQKFVQHTGCGISSRQAEDLLLQYGLLNSRFEEAAFVGHALSKVEGDLAALIGCRDSDVLVCASGMNAFYAGFRAVQEFQRSRKRRAYLQLGWLYLDSGCVLKEFLDEGESLECIYDALDTDGVVSKIHELGESLAGVFVECPSNPLIRVCELGRIAEAVRAVGGVMVVDPTIASVFNVEVLPYADLLVSSLTKYAAIEGDIMIGALAVNPCSAFYGDLILRVSSFYMPPYSRDLARLAFEMQTAPELIALMNRNAARLCGFLRQHPAVKAIYCAGCSPHIEAIEKSIGQSGAVITIELVGDMEKFYDAIAVMKGPSFGTKFTVLCPFMYLAHYDLVTSETGRDALAAVGIAPELIRISVGAEPYEAIEAVFNEALRGCSG